MTVGQILASAQRIRKPAREASVSALSFGQQLQYGAIVIIWAITVAYFAQFWFSVSRVDSWLLYIPITVALFYETIIVVSCYLFFLGHMRIPKHIPAPQGLKVAIISPCVPSKESIEIIERQLRSLVAVTYPHDSWILDEEDDPEVAALCARYGVRHFSRKGVAKWNQPQPPFQAKTKAGNVNAWLFEYGADYSLFVQMDIDHNPVPHYLDRTLGQFQDSRVAWVQAPSVNGNVTGLAARGSSEQSRLLHGPLQMGLYGFCHTPMIIGSHTTYRTSAMLAIGGMQPTRAEDHLDTVVFTHHGYVGVFIPERIATGDGPENFETYLAQEFAWAYSMAQILFQYSYKNLRRYPLRALPAFLFTQTWYPLWSFSLLTLFITPPLMLLLNRSSAAISLLDFLRYYVPLQLCATGICWWSSRWFQPGWPGYGLALHHPECGTLAGTMLGDYPGTFQDQEALHDHAQRTEPAGWSAVQSWRSTPLSRVYSHLARFGMVVSPRASTERGARLLAVCPPGCPVHARCFLDSGRSGHRATAATRDGAAASPQVPTGSARPRGIPPLGSGVDELDGHATDGRDGTLAWR